MPHLIYLAAWGASAVLILLGGVRQRAGALLGVGTSAVTFGFFLADAGEVIAGGAHLAGPGLVLGLVGWLVCAGRLGGGLPGPAARPPGARWPAQRRHGPGGDADARRAGHGGRVRARVDSFTLRVASGATQTVTAGNAFANPAPVIAGDVAVMVALVAVVAAAALWRPARLGAALLAGVIIPMAAQAISALVQVGQAASPAQFGFSPAQAAASGLTISSGLTAAFWIYCAFLVALIASFAWMLFTPPAVPATMPGTMPAPATPDAAGTDAGTEVSHAAGTDAGTEASYAATADHAATVDHAAAGARDGDGAA